MNEPPDPSHSGADKALLEVPAYELKQQAAPFY
jgi:hypothetical protein